MEPELIARVFDLFSQAKRSSDRALGGLGLGLALVRSLVELHSGTVSCDSAGIGKGSRFEMDGNELARRLRQLPSLHHTVLVATTGYGSESDRQRTRAAGFHHHLVKPIDIEHLLSILDAICPSGTGELA